MPNYSKYKQKTKIFIFKELHNLRISILRGVCFISVSKKELELHHNQFRLILMKFDVS